jgi:hypothetical protein
VKKRDELRCIEEKKTKETSPIWESCLERAYLWGERIESIWEKNYIWFVTYHRLSMVLEW